ncbi:MAG TPA: YhdP family protein [Casimicrobiaceae bacterium]|nr:YhdP family protein [Casimicrobiaceae bacterium]
MPAAPAPAGETVARRSRFWRLVAFSGSALAILVALACAALLLVRFVLLPHAERYGPQVAERLSQLLGAPVTIERLATSWDGWNPAVDVIGLRVRANGSDAGDRPDLYLPSVSATVSWLSLVALEPRLKQFSIERPELMVTRLRDGRFRVAGVEFDPSDDAGGGRFVEWLLKQRAIAIHGALVVWNDEAHGRPQVVLDDVEFKLEHPLGSTHHRIGLRGTPPPELAAPIDFRADLVDAKTLDWNTIDGRFYLRLDYADLAALAEWIPWPVKVEEGRGAVRIWAETGAGRLRELTADVELEEVRTVLEKGLAPLELRRIGGRVAWRADGATRRVATEELSMVAREGAVVTPIDFTFEASVAGNGEYRSGRGSVDRLDLASLAAIAASVPMPASWRAELAQFAPRGTLRDARYRWEGPIDAPRTFAAEAEAVELAVAPVGGTPGVSGFSARIQADERGGVARIASRRTAVAMPRWYSSPIQFDTLNGVVRWRGMLDSVDVEALAFASPDAAGTVHASWRASGAGPGQLDLKAQVNRIERSSIARYLPRTTGEGLREWLRTSLTAGSVDGARVEIQGDLAKFPFRDPREGRFAVTTSVRGGGLAYAQGWPEIRDIDTEVRFEGTSLTVAAKRARILGADVGPTRVRIADLSADTPVLAVEGTATGPTTEFIAFVAQSPIAEWTRHALEGAQATGNARLKLRFDLPLGAAASTTVAGEFAVENNTFTLPGVPTLADVNARFLVTERGVSTTDAAAKAFGGPLKFSMTTGGGGVRMTAQGNASMLALRDELPAGIGGRLSGMADWTLALDDRGGAPQWTLESTLRGVEIDLPAPVGKTAGEAAALRVERRPDAQGGGDTLRFELARAGQVVVKRQLAAGRLAPERVLVLLGRATQQSADAGRKGVWVRGDLPTLNVADWLALRAQVMERDGAQAAASMPAVMGIDLDVGVLGAFGRKFNEVKASLRASGDDWRVQLQSREAAGTADWQGATPAAPNGRLVARLARMSTPGAGELTPWRGAETGPRVRPDDAKNPWPEIDVRSESLVSGGRDLGRLELAASPQGADWRISKLVLSSPAGRIEADGWWRGSGAGQRTHFDVSLKAEDADAMLAKFGYPGLVRGAPTTLGGKLEWAGAPSDFEPAALSGSLKIETGAGQFLQIDPGIGRLLGVLSLQALPRRITLDFRDVFSEGFAFDRITGEATIAGGVMSTETLEFRGPAAQVTIRGRIDLARETQDLAVRVKPALSATISAGTAGAAMLLLAANPLVAAAVGAGTLLAQNVMNNPLDQIFSYDYRVTGSWSDPIVERVGTQALTAAPDAQSAAKAPVATPADPVAAPSATAPPPR